MLNILGFRFSKFEIFENPKIFIELIMFWNSSEFFPIPHSFSSGSRIPQVPSLSLCVLLGVFCLLYEIHLPTYFCK